MIPPHARIVLATQPIDFRNYVESRIMRSPGPAKRRYCRHISGMRLPNQALQSA